MTLGSIFGHLTVISKHDTSDKHDNTSYLCRCRCGVEKPIRRSHLQSGSTISCGCVRRKDPGHVSFYRLYLTAKVGAKSRNISFDLSSEQYSQLAKGDCSYCGASPKKFNPYVLKSGQINTRLKLKKDTIDRAWIFANGVDRADNSMGYSIKNCVSCCDKCNHSKKNHLSEDFIAHAYKIVAYQESLKKKVA